MVEVMANVYPQAEKYAHYLSGDSIRVANQIDQLGVEYALYRRREVFKNRPQFHYAEEWWFVRHRLSKPEAWNKWVKKATKITGLPPAKTRPYVRTERNG